MDQDPKTDIYEFPVDRRVIEEELPTESAQLDWTKITHND